MLTGSRGILGRMQYGNWLGHFTLCTGKLLMFSGKPSKFMVPEDI